MTEATDLITDNNKLAYKGEVNNQVDWCLFCLWMLQITLQSSSMEWCWEGVQYQGPGSSCVRGLHIAQKNHYTGKEGTAAAVLSMDSKKDAGYFLLLLYREHLNILHFILLTQLHCSWPGGSPACRLQCSEDHWESALGEIYNTTGICEDPTHPCHHFFELLQSVRCYRAHL